MKKVLHYASILPVVGRVVKLVTTPALGAGAARLGGSSPLSPTKQGARSEEMELRATVFCESERGREKVASSFAEFPPKQSFGGNYRQSFYMLHCL